ncbi:MAG: arginine--tRNA ligase [Candidatus Magasanikbacteria bacterium]
MFKVEIEKILKQVGVNGEINFSIPPKPEMGDLAFACFDVAKEWKMSPIDAAKKIQSQLLLTPYSLLLKIEVFGPYINFFLNPNIVAKEVLTQIKKQGKKYGESETGKKKKIMVEFAHPNTHKAFHIGHLRNIVTGESIARILSSQGYKVIRANYQGDVGMHIAKCLYGISKSSATPGKTIDEKVKFLGEAYAAGSKAFEENEKAKEEIIAINDKIYSQDKSIRKLYKETRQWSLKYFAKIYQRVGAKFDRLYFESETYENGIKITKEFLDKKVFAIGDGGAIIFPGSNFGLHDRVFITAKGFPTYEAKDQALARLQFKEYHPDNILHVVAKEQTEYFKVIIKALEFTCPELTGKEEHLAYGWVTLKDGKMSSRLGNVVLGEWLLDSVKEEIKKVVAGNGKGMILKEEVVEKVAVAAVKYTFLKTGVKNDISFDLNESVSLTGSSGPYLLYIVARIKSILRKAKSRGKLSIPETVDNYEKKLLLRLADFGEVTSAAAQAYDPSQVTHYLFDLAQDFNDFYDHCPVLQADEKTKIFRVNLIQAVLQVMEKGLWMLGIETVEEM